MTGVAPRYEGLLGFREVAGLPTVEGGVVRPGVLYRSGTPQFLTGSAARALVADTAPARDGRPAPRRRGAARGPWAPRRRGGRRAVRYARPRRKGY
ncbi:tyrosine-protein phosphatase [Actinomycetospora aeridis]|uniref:tyrosine-protein phosphatase n=1 Tax=Actinomycetospora aeridis TaxID=3129231 RepID=UPI00359F1DE0